MKTSTKMQLGWFAEIICFVTSGALLSRSAPIWLSLGVFGIGLWLSMSVGDWIVELAQAKRKKR